jgi:hypothetical protein
MQHSLFVALLILSVTLPSSFAVGVSTVLGSTWDIDQDEVALCIALADTIANYSSEAGYIVHNWYGSQTNASNVYLAASGDNCNNSIAFYVGHGWADYVWNYIFWERQWYIRDNDGGSVWDKHIFEYTTSRNLKFAFLWSCEQGDTVGGSHWSGTPFGMPYAWLHTNAIFNTGYYPPDGEGVVFIGFNGAAPFLKSTIQGVTNACSIFLHNFYFAALSMGGQFTILDALDYAAYSTFGIASIFDCILYTGYGPGNMVIMGDIGWNLSSRYLFTVYSPYDSPTPTSGWFNDGTNITETVTSPVAGPTGTQYVCTGWTGTGSVPASGTATSVTFTINAPSSIVWNWKTQYYFTVSSPFDSPTPRSGWFDSGTSITEQVTHPVVRGHGGYYTCWGWEGTGSVPASGFGTSVTFTITQPSSITWLWELNA